MKKRTAALALCLFLLYQPQSLAAELTILPDGTWTVDAGEPQPADGQPFAEADILYLPAAAVLRSLGVAAEESGGVLKAADVTLTAGSDLIIKGGQRLIALRPPLERDGALYVSAAVLQEVFGLAITRSSKDGSVHVRLGDAAEETVDDSWYYALTEEAPVEEMTDLERIHRNILSAMYDPLGDPAPILALMRKDGSFSDIDYGGQDLTSWQPATHLSRLVSLCSRIYCPDNPHYRDPEAMSAVALGIKYWFDNNFVATNWWWNTVAVPGYFQDIALFEPEGVEKYAEDIAEACEGVLHAGNGDSTRPFVLNDPLAASQSTLRSYTGSGSGPPSRIQATLQHICTADLTDEEKDTWIRECMEGLSFELTLKSTPVAYNTSGLDGDTKNIQADYSYHDHGTDLMQNSYGANMLHECWTVFKYLKGTQYKITDEAANELANMILDGFRWTSHNNYMVNTTMGRSAAQYSGPTYYQGDNSIKMYCYLIDMLVQEYPAVVRKSELQAQQAVYANPAGDSHVGNRIFWRSDYMGHSREQFLFAIHTPSTRTEGAESALGINKKGLFLGDGHYNLLKNGDEYAIQAQADWNRLAGTTVEQGYTSFSTGLRESQTGQTDFVGGVSDGLNGMVLMDYDHLGVTAKKAWFCFDDEILCIGAGITSKAKGNIVTTVNQTKLYGEVKAGTGSAGKVLEAEPKSIAGTKWVLHDGIGYVFCGDEALSEEHVVRSGLWWDVDDEAPKDAVGESGVFILSIDHGIKPADASYAYTLLPDTSETELAAYAQSPKAVVVSNTAEQQAAWHKEQKILQAAFYKTGTITAPDGLSVTVSAPCAVMVTLGEGGSYQVCASNPLQKYLKLNVQLSGTVSGSIDFELDPGERGLDAGKTMIYDSREGILTTNPNQGENTEPEEPATLWAIAVNDGLLEDFNPYIHLYTMMVDEIPQIRAKGNFPAQVETTDSQTTITVADPSEPSNQAVYVIRYTIREPQNEN